MDLMGTEQMPGRIQIFLCQSPKPIRITYSRKNIMRLHPIVAVIGAELKKFRQIPMPCIQIYGGGSLAHPQLIYGYCCIIYKTDPADHTSGRTRMLLPAARTFPKYSPMPPPNLLTRAKLSMLL